MFEHASGVIPFCKPINLKTGTIIKRQNRNASTKTNAKNKNVLAIGFNHKKCSKNSVHNK